MGQLNLYYRAFKEYKKYTLNDSLCAKRRQSVKQHSSEEDKLEAIRSTCVIDPKWVERIEIGLPFIERAIAEERQFIKNEGEVLEIEKTKHVSRDSVEHLARHSELITKEPKEDGEIIPDKIFMVERLSDYAVYENRFLYMLLCYLRDFIDLRLKKIKELGNTYKGNTYIRRDMQTANGKIFFEGRFIEESTKDPYASFDKNSLGLIDRIEACQHIIISLLSKPLMVIVGKSPMIKPPITKTNVLKMNNKFKNAVALYEYISTYQGLGYEIIEHKKTISPFTDEVVEELAEIINLTAFLTYEHGNELSKKLKEEYEREEKERLNSEREKKIKQIEALKKKLESGKIEIEEYVNSLEKVLEEIKEDNRRLSQCEKDLDLLRQHYLDVKQEKEDFHKRLVESIEERQNLLSEMNDMKEQHKEALALAEERRITELDNQERELNEQFEAKRIERENEYETELTAVKTSAEEEYSKLKTEHDKVSESKRLISAELHAIKGSKGLMEEEDLTSEEAFVELEKELVAFYDMFVKKWSEAKKKMRNDVLWRRLKKARAKAEDQKDN